MFSCRKNLRCLIIRVNIKRKKYLKRSFNFRKYESKIWFKKNYDQELISW